MNHGDVEEQMGKNGGVVKKLFPIKSIVRDTFIEVDTVQVSLWTHLNIVLIVLVK